MTLPYWPTTKKSLPTNVIREFRGLNRLDPMTIDQRFASDIINITTVDFPIIKTRPGYTLMGTLPERINGLSSRTNSELVAVSNGHLYHGNSLTDAGGGFDLGADMSFANFQGGFNKMNILMSNGIDAMFRWDGTTLQIITGAPDAPDYVETFQDRVWCVTAQNGVKNQLNYSEYRVATNWTTINQDDADPGNIIVEDNRGEPINGIHAGNSHLTIFKPNSIYELYGYSPQDFRIINVTNEVGIFSNQAWTTAKGVQYFVHHTGIYRYSGGTSPDRSFSMRVADYVDRITPGYESKCTVGTDGYLVYIALPIDGNTECSVILEYNTEDDIWSVWNNFSPTHITNINDVIYIGQFDGQVRKIGGDTDNGTTISGYWISKLFGSGASFSQKERWKRAWITYSIQGNGTLLNAYMSSNPDRTTGYELVNTISYTSSQQQSGRIIIPVTAAYEANFLSIKLAFDGNVTIKELAWESEARPIV